jgi:PAS domain S-box-containing protein
MDNITGAEKTKNADEAIEALKRHERTADVLNKMAVTFLSQSQESFEDMMTDGVRPIADMIDLDRMSIWRNFYRSDGLHSSQIYRWERKSGGTTIPTEGAEDFAYRDFIPNWENILKNGGTINGPARLQSEREIATLKMFGIVSVFITPIFINNDFWGIVLFEDHQIERCFEEDHTEIMRSAAFLCANTVIRADMKGLISEENELNTSIIEASRMGFTVFDENCNVIKVNDASLKLFGCDRQYYIDHFMELMPEYQQDGSRSVEKAHELIKRTINGENISFEWTHLTTAGELIPFEITLARTKYRGKYIALSYQYDLRNLNKMTEKLQQQSELLKTRLEQQVLISEMANSFISSGDSQTPVYEALAKLGHYYKVSFVLVFRLDYDSNSTKLAYHWTAGNKPPPVGKINISEMVRSRFPEMMYTNLTVPVISCMDIATSTNESFRMLQTDNVSAFICAPLYVEGHLWGVLTLEQCDEPRNWTENEKKFVSMAASTTAGAIMLDIYKTKMNDAINKLTTASRAKSDFLSNMSHEMRTPMNAIINMTAIAKNAADIERKNYALGKIDDAATHLLGVINDILDMSKIEANKFELVPSDFVFERMLQQTVNVVNFRVEEKHQKLMIHVDKDIPRTLIGDDQRLSQVITNLLGNAVKFTPDNGSITLNTQFLGEENGTCTIQISVTDTGIGITKEQQKILFQSFQQAESSTVRKYGGTGLGLSISKSIVEMMSGKIWIESEPGRGSTFAFTFQAERGEDKKKLHDHAVNLETIRVLAVDDDPDILEFFTDVTQRFNIHCDTAPNGEYALQLLEGNNKYNVYFIDWKMPGLNGIALANEIKARKSHLDNEIIILTSAVEWTEVKDEAEKAGVDKFLPKPLFPSAILNKIYECLGIDNQSEIIKTYDSDNFAGRKILLVEDVEINREIVLTLLESANLEIDCAENGLEAVEMFTENPEKYEMIFMDVQMPEMDGYDATRRIRELEAEASEAHRRVPIIAMTANVFKEDIERCLKAGMNDHLGKPLDIEAVKEKLRLYLK